MAADARNPQSQSAPAAARIGTRQMARALVSMVVMTGAPFVAAGRLDWRPARALTVGVLLVGTAPKVALMPMPFA